MGAIYRREMSAFFISGVAYVFLAVFFLLSGIFFYNGVISAGTTETSSMFSSMFIIVLFLIPILTMKLMSEEKKNRTDQGLLTAPVGLWSIVLGKYFAALTLFIIAESIVGFASRSHCAISIIRISCRQFCYFFLNGFYLLRNFISAAAYHSTHYAKRKNQC